jgi:hypothetical protein
MPDAHNSPAVVKKDFFISYTGTDLQWASWIDALLKAEGLTTVVQCADFMASGDFLTDMDKAVRECHRLMPVFSPAHFRSPFCQLERNTYLALDPDGSKHLILPIVVEACEDLGLFRSRTHVDVSALDENAARETILSAVKTGLAATGPAVFPGKSTSGPLSVVFPRAPLPPNNLSTAGIVKNDSYIPRAAQMAKLEAALSPGATVALTQALQGDGGFGKTEIAKAFLYAHAHEFDGLWWVDASAAGHALATDRLATKLAIEFPPDCDRDQLRAAICEKLAQARHLLVLDNVEDVTVLGAWPVQPPTVRLVTTRLHGAAIEKLHPVEVSELTPEEARALLCQHRADLAGPEHEAALETIATELGHHALAVALAGAWLSNHPTRTPAHLLAGLREESHKISREVLQEMNPQDALGERYARRVFATLTLHLGELKHPWSRTLL